MLVKLESLGRKPRNMTTKLKITSNLTESDVVMIADENRSSASAYISFDSIKVIIKKNEYEKLQTIVNNRQLPLFNMLDRSSNSFNTVNSLPMLSRLFEFACKCESIECIKVFLDGGADINSRMIDNDISLLEYACLFNRIELIKLLMERGIALDDQIIYGCLISIYSSDIHENIDKITLYKVAAVLIEHIKDANYTDNHGNTFLHRASEVGNSDFAKALLYRGADRHAVNGNNEDVITIAFKKKNLTIVKLLLEWELGQPLSIDRLNKALVETARVGHSHHSVIIMNDFTGHPYIHNHNDIYGSVSIALYLISHGAALSGLDQEGVNGLFRLYINYCYTYETHIRDYNKKLTYIKLLLDHGVDVNILVNSIGETALLLAIRTDLFIRINLVTLLLQYNADVSIVLPIRWDSTDESSSPT